MSHSGKGKGSSINKFAAILEARKEVSSENQDPELAVPTVPPSLPNAPTVSRQHGRRTTEVLARPATAQTSEAILGQPRRRGRPPEQGKRSDPTFRPVTIYIPHDLHRNATIALRLANELRIDDDKEDFSELTARLLAGWYEKQDFYKPREG